MGKRGPNPGDRALKLSGTKPESLPPVRRGMQMVGKLVDRGQLAPEVLVDTLAWARKMRDDPRASERVRMRAAELMAKITDRIVAAGVDLDKMERCEQDGATERIDSPMARLLEGRAG